MARPAITACPTSEMWAYSSGEVANSLLINAISAFAMLYYTDALGLPHTLAGWGISVAVLWDAVSDPLMGHISDNTRSRYGRRHQYMLFGGILASIAFLFLWMVPQQFRATPQSLFWYLVVINLVMRTGYTIYVVPWTALGFEMCQEYTGRTRIQGYRWVTNMSANLLFIAPAWAVFFPEKGTAVKDPSNYQNMGATFAAISLLSILFVVFITRKYARDSREMRISGTSVQDFVRDVRDILKDSIPRWVFAFTIVVLVGIMLVVGLQMYLYEHFMRLDGIQKTLTHGGTMVGMMIGAAVCSRLVKRFEKKRTVYTGGVISVVCGVLLTALFVPGVLKPEQTITIAGMSIPFAVIVFAALNAIYWFGNGVMLPVATSMMADASEINEIRTGINKDGSYSAMYSFAIKLATSVGLLVTGYALALIGFESGTDIVQSEDAVSKLFLTTFVIGPVISITALALIRMYPVDESVLDGLRSVVQTEPAT